MTNFQPTPCAFYSCWLRGPSLVFQNNKANLADALNGNLSHTKSFQNLPQTTFCCLERSCRVAGIVYETVNTDYINTYYLNYTALLQYEAEQLREDSGLYI